MDHQYRRAEQQDLHYPAGRFNEKGCLPVWGGDALIPIDFHLPSGRWRRCWRGMIIHLKIWSCNGELSLSGEVQIVPCFLLRVVEGGLKLRFVNSVELSGEGHGHVVPRVAVVNGAWHTTQYSKRAIVEASNRQLQLAATWSWVVPKVTVVKEHGILSSTPKGLIEPGLLKWVGLGTGLDVEDSDINGPTLSIRSPLSHGFQ